MNSAVSIRSLLQLTLCRLCLVLAMQTTAHAQSSASSIQLVGGQQSPWTSGAQSTGKHPLEVARFGKGPRAILIVGSLLGNEPESIALMDATCRLVQANPPPEGLSIFLIRTLNPDGLYDHMRTNANGVELDRNFPSWQFTSIPSRATGPQPASEVETQSMLRILQEYKPVRVIHIRSGVGDRALITLNRLWSPENASPVVPDDVYVTHFAGSFKGGSLEEFVTLEAKTAVATVTLPRKQFRQLQPYELLQFATAHLPQSQFPDALVNQPSGPPPVQSPSPSRQAPPKQDGSKGEVELLPSPPEYAATSVADREGNRDDSRYYELPPPPR